MDKETQPQRELPRVRVVYLDGERTRSFEGRVLHENDDYIQVQADGVSTRPVIDFNKHTAVTRIERLGVMA